MMLNKFELAKEYFADFITFDEKNDLKQEANLYLAKIEYELRNYNSALNYATNAQYLYSDFWELNLILAKVYYSLDMFTHAVNPIQKPLNLIPKMHLFRSLQERFIINCRILKKQKSISLNS